ncbi:ATP-dependent Clp protease proteolytic subunit [Planctomycetales bacterium 10988]|nr:ATP-dependent Clp protease proteolytic subunit [Planctomycetales bacterium 10988]
MQFTLPEDFPEIAFFGDLTDQEGELADKLLSVEPGEECLLFFNSPGGSPYGGIALMSLIQLRGLKATGIVIGECSSSSLWPFAACQRRIVTPWSVLLFHPMRWQSEEQVGVREAAEWSRHFQYLEEEMDQLLSDLLPLPTETLQQWTRPGRFVSGKEFAEAGLAECVSIDPIIARAKKKTRRRKSSS